MIFRFIKTFLVFIIINKTLLIHPCKNCCYVNSSSQKSKFTSSNKNNNFIKQNQIYNDGYNNYKIFTESGQPLKNLKNIKWQNLNCCILSCIRLFYSINTIYKYIYSTKPEDIEKLYNEIILDYDKDESDYSEKLEEEKNNITTALNILINFKELFNELKILNNHKKIKTIEDKIINLLEKNNNNLDKYTIEDVLSSIFALIFPNQKLETIKILKNKKLISYDLCLLIGINSKKKNFKIQNIINDKINTDTQKNNNFIIKAPNILIIQNTSRFKNSLSKSPKINKKNRLQISEFIELPIFNTDGNLINKEKYIFKGAIYVSGAGNNKNESDYSCVIPVFDNKKNKLGFIYSAFDNISNIYPLDYFNKCDNIENFKYPHPIYIFYEKLNIN